MSEQGWTLHLHRMTAERASALLSAQGFRGAILGANDRWCSIAATLASPDDWKRGIRQESPGRVVVDLHSLSSPDERALARALDCDALAVFFDEDSAVTLVFVSPRGLRQGLSVRCHRPGALAPSSLRTLDALTAADLVPAGFRDALTEALARPDADAWVRDHGIERALGLPCVQTFGLGSTFADVRALVADAVEIAPAAKPAGGRPMSN